MRKVLTVTVYRTGSYTPESDEAASRALFRALMKAGAAPEGSTERFTAEHENLSFVCELQDRNRVV